MAKRPQPVATPRPKSQPEASPKDPLQEEIERQIGPLVPQGQREEVVRRMVGVLYQENFAGPIAHPRHLAAYEEIAPGSAERIIAMAEKAQDHNINMQQQSLSADVADQKRGMYLGAGLLLILVVAAFVAGALYNNNVLAGLLLGAAVLNVIALFIQGRSQG